MPTRNTAAQHEQRTFQPLCTSCAYPAPHVYTIYSESNIRLGVCQRCGAFIDPLVENPPLLLVLDLVLLKPRVFLHLLFNRGAPPLEASGKIVLSKAAQEREATTHAADRVRRVHTDVARLFVATLITEVAVRLVPALPLDNARRIAALTAMRVMCELSAQMAASTLLTLLLLRFHGWYPPSRPPRTKSTEVDLARDGREESFLPALVPLVLLYTTLLPLLLQLVLGIWYAAPSATSEATPVLVPPSLLTFLPSYVLNHLTPTLRAAVQSIDEAAAAAAETWASSDRIWAGTRLLGGMSAGFGLRVLLPTRPWETTLVVLVGWSAAVAAGNAFDAVLGVPATVVL